MKPNEKTMGVIVLIGGAFLLWYLYQNGQLGTAAANDVGAQPTSTVSPLGMASPNINFNVGTTNLNVVSYVPLFGFIGVGQFWS